METQKTVNEHWIDELKWLAEQSKTRRPLVATVKKLNRDNTRATVSVGYFDRRNLFRCLDYAFVQAGFKWADDLKTGFRVSGCGLDRIMHALEELIRVAGIEFENNDAHHNFIDYNLL